MIQLLVTVIALIAIIAVVIWFVGKVQLQPPLIYVIYAGVAILCILAIAWVANGYGVLRL